ncbi:hypothetical protein [Sphingobium subterraneum]|uniref:Uncharacterized protein n=1 Tax=Sphingobium subterraneum TaxID=627688 RepID=A0A841J3S1_9SPHN|nr:hypothetical protein [Sphingobium subterraneum]MBB6123245.1 hypothetical protein [Sphingobium subterraneum]
MMRGTRYSSREGRWYGERRNNTPLPETVRDEREFLTDFGNGVVRIDIGAPIHRLPDEPQPVAVSMPLPLRRAAPELPAVTSDIPPAHHRKVPKDHREFKPGIGRG